MSDYTPEQLREWADDWEKDAAGYTENWRRTVYLSHAAQLRAHATTLEQLPAAQAEIERLREDLEEAKRSARELLVDVDMTQAKLDKARRA